MINDPTDNRRIRKNSIRDQKYATIKYKGNRERERERERERKKNTRPNKDNFCFV